MIKQNFGFFKIQVKPEIWNSSLELILMYTKVRWKKGCKSIQNKKKVSAGGKNQKYQGVLKRFLGEVFHKKISLYAFANLGTLTLFQLGRGNFYHRDSISRDKG